MKPELPKQLRKMVDKVLEGEIQISYASSEPYNAFVAEGDGVTAVSASGRVMVGCDAVKQATVTVADGNTGETGRFVEYIAGDATEDMMYALFKTGVTISKSDGSASELCWVVTFVFRKMEDGRWMLVHRHNTRSKP